MSEPASKVGATGWRNARLLEARSVLGAVAIVAVVGLFVVLVPNLEDSLEQTGGLDEAGRFVVDDFTTIMLADGWEVDSRSELFTILTDGTHQLILPVSNEDPTAPEEKLAEFRDVYAEDPDNQVTEVASFTTEAGAAASEYRALLASDPTGQGAGFAAVSQNGRLFEPSTTGPSDLDDAFYDTFVDMVRSIMLTAEPRGDGS